MEIPSKVYKHYLASSGIKRKLWYYARKILIKLLSDPTCTMPVHGRILKLPLSHQLPAILKYCQFYDQLPSRVSTHVHHSGTHLTCVDVGANIGDTIASFYTDEEDIFLAIEPYAKFNNFLATNWGWNKNIIIISDICSSESNECTFAIQEKNGTASIAKAENGTKKIRRTLDEIVDGYPFAPNINIIKIDTDGHDLEVIAGAVNVISRNMPIILFECEPITADYITNCLNTLKNLQEMGYTSFLLYDSRGNLLGMHLLSDLASFQEQLLYQMEYDFHDFEVLIMKDEDIFEFYRSETDYFKSRMP